MIPGEIASPLSSSRNTAAGRLSSRPKGAPQMRQGGVTALGKSVAIPCALCLALPRLGGSEGEK